MLYYPLPWSNFSKKSAHQFCEIFVEKKKTISLILNPPHRILFRGYPALYTATKAIRKSSDHSLRTQGRRYPAKIDYFEIPYCNFRFYLLICLCCISLYRGQNFRKNRHTNLWNFRLKKGKQFLYFFVRNILATLLCVPIAITKIHKHSILRAFGELLFFTCYIWTKQFTRYDIYRKDIFPRFSACLRSEPLPVWRASKCGLFWTKGLIDGCFLG